MALWLFGVLEDESWRERPLDFSPSYPETSGPSLEKEGLEPLCFHFL